MLAPARGALLDLVFSAMVLAAGFGTRLRPLTLELPKPLVPVGDRPLLVSILEELLQLGASEIAVNVHHQPDKIDSKIKSLGLNVHVISEERIRGTAGGVAGARGVLGPGPVVVVNGDIFGPLPARALLERGTETALLAVTPRAKGEGTVGLDEGGRVVRLRGELFGEESAGGDFMGVSLWSPQLVRALPEEGCLVGDVALPLLRSGGQVDALVVETEFDDIGSPEAYWRANVKWVERTCGPGGVYLGPGATVAPGVELRRSVIGAGARLEGEGLVEDVVLWPGAVARAPLARSVVTSGGASVVIE